MKKITCLVLLGFAMLKPCHAQQFNANLSVVLQNYLDSLVTSFSNNTKGVSVGIYCPGQGYWSGVSGISHPGTPITPDMSFGMASNTKLFTAVTMLRLAEDQLLNLEDPLSAWLPNIPNVDHDITIRQLLNHTSGISDPFFTTALLDSIQAHPTHVYTLAEVFSWLGAPSFPKGTSYGYSNINYILAGKIAENATGLTMAQLIRNYIFTPLSLDHSFCDYAEAEIGTIAYRWQNGVDIHDTSRVSLNSAGGPAGYIFSNGDDMAHWYHTVMDGQLLTPDSFDQLTDFVTFGNLGNYGLGLQRTSFFNRETWGHGGSTLGYKSRSIYDPCSKFVVCGVANDDWAAIDAITLLMYKRLVDLLPDCSVAPINGVNTLCQGEQGITYTVPAITNATSYSWTLPNGATGVSATNSITVDYALNALSGDVSVKGINMFGEGAPVNLTVTVNPIPATPTISQAGNTLHSDAPNGNQWYDANGILAGEINPDFNVVVAGDYHTLVTLLGCTSEASNTITGFDLGMHETEAVQVLKVFPNPTSGEVMIELKGSDKTLSYSITNALDQEVLKGSFMQQTTLPTDKLEAGVYVIHLEGNGQSLMKKIVKH